MTALCCLLGASLALPIATAQEIGSDTVGSIQAPAPLREAIDEFERDALAAAARETKLREQRERSAREIERLSETIRLSIDRQSALEKAVAGIETDEAKLRREAINAAAERERIQSEIEKTGDRLAVLSVRERDVLEDLASRRDVLAEVLAALQRMGRNPPPALLVTPEDALASVRSAILMGAVVPALRSEAEKLVNDLTSLKRVRERTEEERRLLDADLIAAAEGEERLKLIAQARRDALERKGRDLEAERTRVAQLAERAGTLEELSAALEQELAEVAAVRSEAETNKERAEREAAVAAAEAISRAREDAEQFAALPKPPAPTIAEPAEEGGVAAGVFADADPARDKPAFAFASLTGALELPVAGSILRGFERGGGGADVRTKGLVVGGRKNGLVRAPVDGWVDFAGPFRSYGEIVIMNLGDGYRMVLSGLDSSDVALGQFVQAGEPIGRLPDAGLAGAGVASATPALYIELRRGADTLDPAPWFRPPQVARADG